MAERSEANISFSPSGEKCGDPSDLVEARNALGFDSLLSAECCPQLGPGVRQMFASKTLSSKTRRFPCRAIEGLKALPLPSDKRSGSPPDTATFHRF